MGMFGQPNPYVVALITLSPYRGIFWLAPILILGLLGWVIWLREGRFAAEARLGIAIFGFFFLVNASFNGYHGGFAAGPGISCRGFHSLHCRWSWHSAAGLRS
jgi:hypothetical protein